jgi:hypothetical protein
LLQKFPEGTPMGNGRDADVGHLPDPKAYASKICGAEICGAMAEQRGRNGSNENESTPQQFLHLVGCRDPNSRRAPWVRPRPASPKP